MYTKKKKVERAKFTHLPPSWCSDVCQNSMNEACIDECAPKKDCSWFIPRPNLKVEDLHIITLDEAKQMSGTEKYYSTWLDNYVIKRQLQGVPDEPIRHYSNGNPNRPFPQTINIKGVVYDRHGRVDLSEDEQEHKVNEAEPEEVAEEELAT